jgi:outer membrane protein TolC
VFAQFPPGSGQSQSSQVNQLPLSGRMGQGGSVTATESPVPGTTTSVDTINPSIQVQGPYAGSVPSGASLPFSGKLSLNDAIERGLRYNLGTVGLAQTVRAARGQRRVARSVLLPNLNGNLSETVQQTNLEAFGLRFQSPLPGFAIPTVVGPFNYFDLRATLSQKVADITAWNNYRSAVETVCANEFSAQDARDLVVLAVGGAYLQVVAAEARVQSARAQLKTADALYQQTSQQHSVGLVAQIDVNRSRVQMLTQRQRLLSLENDFAKQKINLARITGLPPNDRYEVTTNVPFAVAPVASVNDAVKQAFEQRADIKAAEAQVRAAERARSAARAERLPSLSVRADYGAIGTNPVQAHGTFSVVGSLRFPIWQGGRIGGDIEQADAALAQRQAELDDLRGRVEADVRDAYLDIQAAASQVDVARENLQVSRQNLDLTRQRFDAGVSDNLDVVQSQESVASAELDYINSVFAHNVAKLSLARATGRAAEHLAQFLNLQ